MKVRRFFAIFENPLIWMVNLSAAGLSWKYWESFAIEGGGWGSAIATLVSLVLLAVSTFWVYLRDDKQVREFLRENGARAFFTTEKSRKKFSDNSLLTSLYEKSSITKFTSANVLAGVWTFSFLAIVLATPSNLPDSSYLAKVIAGGGLGLAVIMWLVVSKRLFTAVQTAKSKWFSLSKMRPKNSLSLTGVVQGAVLCRSPEPIANWGGKRYHVCQISALNGPQMPGAGKVRNAIEWTYIEP